MRRALLFLVVAWAVVACSDDPAASPAPDGPTSTSDPADPADPSVVDDPGSGHVSSAPDPEPAVFPEGFERVQATVTEADGSVCDVCLWLAADADQRSRGLMFVTDLGPADGMAFLYPAARTGNFWMKNTVLPLSIAFYGPTGGYLDAIDMEPCAADPCPMYRTAPDFLIAVETVQGGLADLGMVPGSVLDLTDLPCDEAGT